MRKIYTHKIFALCASLIIALFIGSCRQETKSDKAAIFVSISPLKYIVESIVGADFEIQVLVPDGASPESFEPTPKQYIALNEAKMVINVGLIDFEQGLISRLKDKKHQVNLSQGVDVIAGSCSHNHHGEHHHGVDPHIWTSPVELQRMSLNFYNAITKLYPDSLHYLKNYEKLQSRLEELDTKITCMILASGVESFFIHHPAYTYFARDYNLEQVAIEDEGKEPSTRHIGALIQKARAEGITKVLYQKQFPSSVVDVIAGDIGAEALAVDPLSEDIIAHIEEFTTVITSRR
ncbi:MAG: zinc ABC transporter substrate-binding protein [Rikenellaceae bacterium]